MQQPDQKLLSGVNRFAMPEYSVDDWNQAVIKHFGPFVADKSTLVTEKEILRSELINLARVISSSEGERLLHTILALYREVLSADRPNALAFMQGRFAEVGRADQAWMGLFLTNSRLHRDYPLTERVTQVFSHLETVLEGCYKPHLRVLAAFSAYGIASTLPSKTAKHDFGTLLRTVQNSLGAEGQSLILDSELGIEYNQWRNIAAHRSFEVSTRSTIEVEYGSATRQRRGLTFAALRRTLSSAIAAMAVVRMANTLVYLECMPELNALGLPQPQLRFESTIVGLCHNLSIVGFRCLGYSSAKGCLTLSLIDRLGREPLESVLHASQVLDQLGVAVELDVTRKARHRYVEVEVLSPKGIQEGRAQITVADVTSWTKGELTTIERIDRTTFVFTDQKRLKNALLINSRNIPVSV